MFATAAVSFVVAGITLPSTTALARTSSKGAPDETMIVMLRNQNPGLSGSGERGRAVRAEQAPFLAQLHASGATNVVSLSAPNALIAKMSSGEAASLAANSAVKQVVPNSIIPGPVLPTLSSSPLGASSTHGTSTTPAGVCGTSSSPQLDPEALANINATAAQNAGFDGAGVQVGFMADGIDTSDPDFLRNSAYATASSKTGAHVINNYEDFSSDGIDAPTAGGEAFLDASSIVAQGNHKYDLSNFVAPNVPLPKGCDIKLVGVAPGASLDALKIFGQNNDTTTAGFLQAINWAVANGVQVLNQSFGGNDFPETALDVIYDGDNAAVAAGVTVVASSGDAGSTGTIGSPATDPKVISVGATTTFRAFEQTGFGGSTYSKANGKYVDNNVSSFSSGGFNQPGNTVDLVAPGDWNWALCDANLAMYSECTNFKGTAANIEFTGGTSEAAPLTAGAAADVIQAYSESHHGTDPTPAMVKQILMSSATDIDAPADQQGAGLLNVLAAVKLAQSMPATTVASPSGGVTVSPNQINVVQPQMDTTTKTISVSNHGTSAVTVDLSTRDLTHTVATSSGSFCMQPGAAAPGCPANTGVMQIWSDASEVYEAVKFTVPKTTGVARLDLASDYTNTDQASLVHVAVFEPGGTQAGYSDPQGLGDYNDVQVANPPAGTWTAVFFTLKNGTVPGETGSSGTIQWAATTSEYRPAGKISPAKLVLGPAGSATATKTASLMLTSTKAAGDTAESVVVATPGAQTTIPVTVRTMVTVTSSGGTFTGVITGGNGRPGAPGQTNTYAFAVPKGERDIDASVALATDPGEELVAYLVNPDGQSPGYSSNISTDNFLNPTATPWLDVYAAYPKPGLWELVVETLNPVTGFELDEPFHGSIQFNQVSVTSNVPRGTSLKPGTYQYRLTVNNTGIAPEAYFVDPRLNANETVSLANQDPGATPSDMTLPLPASEEGLPYYYVPPETSELEAGISSTVPVSFDSSFFPGDPDISPSVSEQGVVGTVKGDSASLTYTQNGLTPGLWDLNPAEVGPFPASGAPTVRASAYFKAVTRAFDPSVVSSTGDLWSLANGVAGPGFNPIYVPAGESTSIVIQITVKGATGSTVSGRLFVEDYTLGALVGVEDPDGDVLAAVPFSYKVAG
ncbi:MAG: S8 family peptidase [Acidimicrobiales bacterium]